MGDEPKTKYEKLIFYTPYVKYFKAYEMVKQMEISY